MKPMSTRVLSRFIEADSGWDPKEGPDDPDPSDDWNAAVKMFPKALQKLLGDPRPKTTHGHGDVTVAMTEAVDLGEDSGVELTATALRGEDADEDGPYRYANNDVEYFFWIGHKRWSGSESRHLKHDLNEFARELEKQDPEGYKKAGF